MSPEPTRNAAERTPVEAILKRDRIVVVAGLAGVTAVCWAYLVILDMPEMPPAAALAGITPWTAVDFVLMLVMWMVMMVGMMLPSAAPMILLFTAVNRRNRGRTASISPVGAFVSGYVVAWSAFSVGATVLQWAFQQAALLSPAMVATGPILGGVLLIAAGLYQWTPIKDICLKHCRTPFTFVAQRWRPGTAGALRMGVEHGWFCVGCCWVLMGLLFFGGVMNLLWIAAIAVFVLLEKLAPRGRLGGRLAGAFLVLAGTFVIFREWQA